MRTFLILITLIPCVSLAYPVKKYIGFGTGYTWTQAQFNDKIRTIGAIREVPSYSSVDNKGGPWQGFMGFQFHPNYGIEMGYMTYGTITFDKILTTNDDSNSSVTAISKRHANISNQGFFFQQVLSYSIFEQLQLQFRAGLLFGSTLYDEEETLTTFSEDTGETTIVQPNTTNAGFVKGQLSLAALYRQNQNWSWRLQLNQIQIDHKEEQESFSQWFTNLSLQYHL